jgi:predicted LPLAT superfamily acyltransferase
MNMLSPSSPLIAPAPKVHWAQMRECTFAAGLRLMFRIHRHLGRGPFLWVLYPVVFYFWAMHRSARLASMQYLQRMHQAHGNLDGPPTWHHSLRHFMAFANTILDKTLAMSGSYRFEALQFTGRQDMADMLASGRGGVIITAHVGCLELCQAASHYFGRAKLNVLVHIEHAEKFNAVLEQLSNQQLVRLIHVKDITPATAVMLAERVAQGEFVAIAGDRIPVQGSKTVSVPFLNHDVQMPVGPYVLAALLKCPLFLMGCLRKGTSHAVHFEKLADAIALPRKQRLQEVAHYAAIYTQKLEALLVQAPFEWFNFFPFWDQQHDLTSPH